MRFRSNPVCPSDPFDCHCWPPCYSAAGREARRLRQEQHDRRVRRFGADIVAEMEAKVDAMAELGGGLTRDNVLSLMEGMIGCCPERLT